MSFVSRSASIRISRALGRLNALSIKQSRSLSTVLRFQSPSQRAALISLGLDPDEGRASPRSQEQLPSDEFEHQQWQPRRQPSETLMRSARHSFDPPAKISNIHSYYHREPQLVMIEELGIVQGEMDSSRLLTKYLNIPFGLVQDRLNPAVAPEPWKGIRDATVMGPMCPQSIEDTNNLRTTMLGLPGPGFEFSERDCLNLNVFAPRCVDNIPVICYIHGGGLEHGGNALPKN
ncbi:Carboxylesterase 3, partial [Lunasporangiospora selenospora]